MKTILFINHEPSSTGAPLILHEIAKHVKKDFKVCVLHLCKGWKNKKPSKELNQCINLKLSSYFKAIDFSTRKIKKIYRKINPDLIYCNTIVSYQFARVASELNIKTLLHIHEREDAFNLYLPSESINHFKMIADKFICTSENVYTYLRDKLNCNENKLELLNGFISSADVLRKSNEMTSLEVKNEIKANEETIVLYLGSVTFHKGQDLFEESAKTLTNKYPGSFKFISVGKLPPKFDSSNKSVLYLDEKKNPFPYLKSADIYVQPSRSESLSLSVLEAMTLEKPIIAFKHSGGPYEIMKNDCGMLVDEMSGDSLTRSILELSQNEALKIKIAKQGPMIQKKYDSDVMLPRFKQIIEEQIK